MSYPTNIQGSDSRPHLNLKSRALKRSGRVPDSTKPTEFLLNDMLPVPTTYSRLNNFLETKKWSISDPVVIYSWFCRQWRKPGWRERIIESPCAKHWCSFSGASAHILHRANPSPCLIEEEVGVQSSETTYPKSNSVINWQSWNSNLLESSLHHSHELPRTHNLLL